MMADFVTPRHSAVMERLRRRIELFRQHHNNCETRYDGATPERLELDRQHTISLHQRLLQNKAKRASKHRQPPPSAEQDAPRAPGIGAEGGGTAAEQSRNTTRQVLHDVVKRKLEGGGSPLSNGVCDGVPANKKACLENGAGPEAKPGLTDRAANGPRRAEPPDPEPDFHQKEMKQEPEDILPIMPPSVAGGNGLFLDLNLNEQEWKELMEELNCSVPIEDIQDILNYSFEDRKDPPGGPGAAPAPPAAGPAPPPPDLSSVKAEFSPAPAAFEPDSRTGSPRLRAGSAGALPLPAGSPAASGSAPSPAPPPRPLQLLPPQKDLSPAQQLQQLAAQQRAQHIQGKMHKPPPGAKFHGQGPHGAPAWTQMANSSQSPALYPSDFAPAAQKQLLLPAPPAKGSPKAGAGGYLLPHLSPGPPLSHPAPQSPATVLNYKNTIPLSHYEAGPGGPGPPRAPSGQGQDKAALLSLLRQQKQSSMSFRPHLTHPQDQNFSAPPHVSGPANSMTSGPGNNAMAAAGLGPSAMAGNHGNTAFLRDPMAALKQQQFLQRQLLAEQEKQRQDQQLQRHLTRPPPQYQDQAGPAAGQNPFPQQNVAPFTGSSQSISNMGSMGSPAPGARMFPQNQGMMGMSMAQGAGPGGSVAAPPAASQADISLPSCGGGGAGVDSLYGGMTLHPGQQRQPLGPMGAPYRQLPQQQLLKPPGAVMLKQQQLAATRMQAGGMGGAMAGATWQQQPAGAAALHANAFAANAFHMQQPRIPKMAAGSSSFGGRAVPGLNQQMMQTNMAAQQRAPPAAQTQHQPANQSGPVLPDLAAYGAPQAGGRQALPCNQGYQVSRGGGQQQQQLSFGYNAAAGSFAAESDLVDSLLKGQSTQEWMADLDELLAGHT
ncbi:mastermind-like protein 1 isoform X1 [Xiphophorus couchianus]|uniref:mastermind-like protein 1 isoform X1 n=2 Tax=Xiphophorus couchianus TaxID=32473 RepID=UPI00101674AA|nr:mastermind-like protein 1 isoform X1 [Xiphophorus couchianus]